MFENINSVREVLGGEIVLVGEDHSSDRLFRELARDVIEHYEPGTVAIEARRPGAGRRCTMGELQDFASQTGVPLIAIDTPWRQHAPSHVDTTGIYSVINNTSVDDEGNYDPAYKGGAKGGTMAAYGGGVAEAIWDKRESDMAARLFQALEDDYPTPIVAGVGVYHLVELAELLEEQEVDPLELTPNRVRDAAAP